ncbi:MAG: tetratricopeptide repeat protein [Ignavibacteriaceae bacterium]|jgi:tetratricopeptide (TPR) repeat protein|nr:tetratricopeptide repeat protein [Ignavibacteriaceae bacterium]
MKKYIFFLFILLSSFGFSQSLQKELEQANQYYKTGNYKEAITKYETVLHNGYHGASLFYNLGNAYYRTGKFGLSILYFEKAYQLSPDDEDIRHNLIIANSKIVDKVDVVPKFFLFSWWEATQNLFHPSGWKTFMFVVYLLLIITIGIFFTAKRSSTKKYSFFSGASILFFFSLSVVLFLTKQHQVENYHYGIVLEQTVNVKSSPDEKSSDAFILHEGIKIKVEDKLEGWNKIRLSDGKIGWLESLAIGII